MVKAVIVEDDVLTRVTLSELLESEGFGVRAFGSTDEALLSCLTDPPQILISDLCVPGSLGTRDLARCVRKASSGIKIVFITGYDSEDVVNGSPDLVDVERYSKPLDFDALIASLRGAEAPAGNPVLPRDCGI